MLQSKHCRSHVVWVFPRINTHLSLAEVWQNMLRNRHVVNHFKSWANQSPRPVLGRRKFVLDPVFPSFSSLLIMFRLGGKCWASWLRPSVLGRTLDCGLWAFQIVESQKKNPQKIIKVCFSPTLHFSIWLKNGVMICLGVKLVDSPQNHVES